MQGYEVTNERGERAWWDGKKLTPLDANGYQAQPPRGGIFGGGAPRDVKTDLAVINKAKEEAASTLDTATKLERFRKLNEKQATGPLMGARLPFLPSVGDAFVAPFSPAYQEMKAIQAQLTPQQREPGSGATSDFDARMYREALPGVDKYAETNEGLYQSRKTDAVKANARAAFLDRYYARAGTLSGADAAFNKFWVDYSKQQKQPSGGPGRLRYNPETDDLE